MRTIVYISDISPLYQKSVYEAVYQAVSETRRKKTDEKRFMKDRCRSLGAEFLLMNACRDFGLSYRSASVQTDENGKPFLAGEKVFFNLSHSGEETMCVMSDAPVGCDVEKIERPNLDLAKRFFSKEETAEILEEADEQMQKESFYRFWTLKESYVKCRGLGLGMALDSFTISLKSGAPALIKPMNQEPVRLAELDLRNGYRYAWCVQETGENGRTDHIVWKDICLADLGRLLEN